MISKTMHGNFSGVQLDQITSLKISKDTSGFTRTSFRVIGGDYRSWNKSCNSRPRRD
jgi:hypothetical protein